MLGSEQRSGRKHQKTRQSSLTNILQHLIKGQGSAPCFGFLSSESRAYHFLYEKRKILRVDSVLMKGASWFKVFLVLAKLFCCQSGD
jgi:hypothetical protein